MKRQSLMSAAILMVVLASLTVGTAVLAIEYSDGYAEATAVVTTPGTEAYQHDEDGSADARAGARIGYPPPTSTPPPPTNEPFSSPQNGFNDPSTGLATATSTASATNNSRADDWAEAVIDNDSQGTATAVSSAVARDGSYSGNETEAIITNNGTGTATATSTAVATDNSEAGNYTIALIDGLDDLFSGPDSEPQVFSGGYASGSATVDASASAVNSSYAGNMLIAGVIQGEGSAYAEATATAANHSWAGSMTQVIVANDGPGNIAAAHSWTEADNNSRAGVISAVAIAPEGLNGEFTSYGVSWADNYGEALGFSIIVTGDMEEDFFYEDVSLSPTIYTYQPGVYFDVDGGAGGVAIAIVYVESLNKATTFTFSYGIGGDAAALAIINGDQIQIDALVGDGILDDFDVPGFGAS